MTVKFRVTPNSTGIANELAPRIALAVGRTDKELDIAWVLKELIGNIRHSPNQIGYIKVDDSGDVTLTNCAVGDHTTSAEKHGMGLPIARSLGAVVNLTFIQREYGCWRAITNISWDFETVHINIRLEDIP